MPLQIPHIVARYFAAEHEGDAKRLSLCFTEDGFVHDDGQSIRGQDAIRRWKEEADAKYKYTSEPLTASTNGHTVLVRARLTGNFPGSPIELNHVFAVSDDKIVSLEIHS